MAKLKTVELKVKLHSVDDNLVKNNFHVVPNLAVSCILGMDFITNLEFRLNTASRRISYKNDGKQFNQILQHTNQHSSVYEKSSSTTNRPTAQQNRNYRRRSRDNCRKNHQRLETAASIIDAHLTCIAGRARSRGGAYPRARASSNTDEEAVGVYNRPGGRRNHAKFRQLRHRGPAISKKKSRRNKSEEKDSKRHHEGPFEVEDSLPGHLKELRRTLSRLRETAKAARRNLDQVRRLSYDASIIQIGIQQLVGERMMKTDSH
jgi:hypothetical protein